MQKPRRILVVDDNPDALETVGSTMRAAGYQVLTAADGREAWQAFRARRPDLVISDVRMPDESGIDLLRRIRQVSDAPVILLTAHADVSVAVAALREGATDFLRFPEEVDELLGRAQALLPPRTASEPEDAACATLPGDSLAMRELRGRVRALASLDVPVLVSGESGTGRMAVVRALHALAEVDAPLRIVSPTDSEVPDGPCAVVLIALEAWPRELQERWAAALRTTAGGRLSRLYTIASPGLQDAVERGDVRRDLWVSSARFRIDVPPLRSRAADIPQIARQALTEISENLGRRAFVFTPGALDALSRRPWRGNVPELYEVLEQAVAFASDAKLDRAAIDRAVEAVIAAREDSLANRRAARENADREQLIRLLSSCRGNVAEIARQLGMTRGAVTYRLRKHGLAR
jgi:DNA-binding NtrC family response regulator